MTNSKSPVTECLCEHALASAAGKFAVAACAEQLGQMARNKIESAVGATYLVLVQVGVAHLTNVWCIRISSLVLSKRRCDRVVPQDAPRGLAQCAKDLAIAVSAQVVENLDCLVNLFFG